MSKEIKSLRPQWKGTLTDRERFNRQMHFQSVDRCFNKEFGYWNENFEQWPMFRDNGITNNGEADRALNFDRISEIGCPWMHPGFERKTIRETETSRIIQNDDGLLAEIPKDGHDTIPHFIESPIKDPDDWKRIKEERFRRGDPARRMDIARIKRDWKTEGRTHPLGVNCGSMIGKVRDLLTVEGLAYHIYDYPEMVEDMVETCCLIIEDFLDQVLPEFDFDFASGWEDICYNRGPLVGLDFFDSVVVPRYQRITRKLRQHGIDIYYTDCDGDVRFLLPYFLKSGINTLFPFEINGCGDPCAVLEQYEGQIRIMGGVNKMILAQGPEATRAYLEKLKPWVEKGGFIPHCDHRCPPDVGQENYLAYLDIKEKLFGQG